MKFVRFGFNYIFVKYNGTFCMVCDRDYFLGFLKALFNYAFCIDMLKIVGRLKAIILVIL